MRIGIACLAVMLAAGLAIAPVSAQEATSGTIAGKITDPAGKPIAGAVVIVTSQYGTRTSESDADGNYIVPFLKPGSYSVRVEAAGGFNTVIRNDVTVRLNERNGLNVTLEPGKTETVTVTGETPLVDIKSTASTTNVKYDEFANAVPLGRSFTDTYAVAPGVVSGLGTGSGNYSISGSSGLENSYLIDGVNVTNTGYGGIGAYNIVYGSLGTGVTSEFLDEVQIKTGGFEAEYGQALGGIINTIVKSGTNDFKGSVAWFATPSGLRDNYTLVTLDSGNSNLVSQNVNDFAFSVGGPIKKDKLFYFVAYNPVITTQRNRATDLLNPGFDAAFAGNPRFVDPTVGFDVTNPLAFPSSGQDLERKRTANNYAVKFTWQPSAKHQFELTVFGDPAKGDRGPQRDTAPRFTDFATGGGESTIEFGSNNGTLKWNAVFSPKFFLEAQVGRHVGKFRETSVKDEIRYSDLRNNLEFRRGATSYSLDGTSGNIAPFGAPILPVTTLEGGVGFISNQDDKNTQYQLKFTSIAGNHEVKFGVEYDDISYLDTGTYTGRSFNVQLPVSDTSGNPVDNFTCTAGACSGGPDGLQDVVYVPTRGGAQVSVRNGVGGDPLVAFDSGNRFRVTRARMGPALPPTSAREYSAFVQDTWSITPRFTVKAGVRITEEQITGSGSFTLPFGTETVDVSGVPTRIYFPGTSSYRPNRYSFSGNLAPRLGVIWDVLGNGKSRLYANFGRYFERVPSDLAVRAFSNEVGVSLQE
ncbi:MAG TPA: TonB-dependent receptor, partial [Candidatus Polarisedimenticolia bacterium]|nr:TonB-dependent receptor [Candidatus Polarisedimenticolia bacterium]